MQKLYIFQRLPQIYWVRYTSASNGRILKANLSWTRKNVELEWCKNIFVCLYIFLFWTKSRTSRTQVWVLSG